MAAVDFKKVRRGFRERLRTVANLPPVIFENRSAPASLPTSTGTTKPLFIKEELLKGRTIKSSMANLEANSQMIYSVHCAAGQGTELSEELAEKINNVFQANTVVLYQGYEIIIERAYQGDPYEDTEGKRTEGAANWYVCPVIIMFRLHVSDPV